MSDYALFLGWNRPARGREAGALAVLGESVQFFGELQEAGGIESFEVFLLEPHGGDLNGFILIRGELADLNRLRHENERFATMLVKNQLYVDGLGVLGATTGAAISQTMGIFSAALGELS
ncbi:MAG: hypothetical protein ABSD78_13810 [Acidimicrobiales bacterium]|jgi:hypothetical protein